MKHKGMAGLVALIVACSILPNGAAAKGLCGVAYNFANQKQGRVRVKGARTTGITIDAHLVCPHPAGLCNGRTGRLHGTFSQSPGGGEQIQGALTYGTRLTCDFFCVVSGVPGAADTSYECQFTCPATAGVVQASFTVQKGCQPVGGPV